MNAIRSCLALAVLCAAPLLAEEPMKMEMGKPAPEMAQLAIFKGTWSCNGTTFQTDMGPEHATTATVQGKSAVRGMWIHLTYDEKKTAKNPMPVSAAMFMGYDAAKKSFVLGCVDSYGGYCTETSGGWSGDTMVFEGIGNMGGEKVPVRDTFTKKGESQLTHKGELQKKDGAWMTIDEEVCKKGK